MWPATDPFFPWVLAKKCVRADRGKGCNFELFRESVISIASPEEDTSAWDYSYVRTGVPQSQRHRIIFLSFILYLLIILIQNSSRAAVVVDLQVLSRSANKEASMLSCSVNAAQTGKASETLDSRDVGAVMLSTVDEKGGGGEEGEGGRGKGERIASQRG